MKLVENSVMLPVPPTETNVIYLLTYWYTTSVWYIVLCDHVDVSTNEDMHGKQSYLKLVNIPHIM